MRCTQQEEKYYLELPSHINSMTLEQKKALISDLIDETYPEWLLVNYPEECTTKDRHIELVEQVYEYDTFERWLHDY